MTRYRATWFAVVLTVVLAAQVSAQRQSPAGTSCYRFDRSYFGWVGRPPAGGEVLIDSSRVIRLDSAVHPRPLPFAAPQDARPVRVPSMSVDSSSTRRWLEWSFWRPIGADSIELQWRNGFYGPVFRMATRRDSLEGRVRFTTDVVGADPPPQSAFGVRVPCP